MYRHDTLSDISLMRYVYMNEKSKVIKQRPMKIRGNYRLVFRDVSFYNADRHFAREVFTCEFCTIFLKHLDLQGLVSALYVFIGGDKDSNGFITVCTHFWNRLRFLKTQPGDR